MVGFVRTMGIETMWCLNWAQAHGTVAAVKWYVNVFKRICCSVQLEVQQSWVRTAHEHDISAYEMFSSLRLIYFWNRKNYMESCVNVWMDFNHCTGYQHLLSYLRDWLQLQIFQWKAIMDNECTKTYCSIEESSQKYKCSFLSGKMLFLGKLRISHIGTSKISSIRTLYYNSIAI